MAELPKISIVTVNLNGAEFLEEAILSVLDQNYPNLEYIIMDGGSTDNSIEIIKKYADRITYWQSKKDDGHVYSINEGLQRSTGDIMAWLNSDDRYFPGSFQLVAELFNKFDQLSWLTSLPVWYNKEGIALAEMKAWNEIKSFGMGSLNMNIKWSRWSKYRYLNGDFMAIQQESTFWRRSLWEKAGAHLDTDYKLAFDIDLWNRFFKVENLYTLEALLGGFRYRDKMQHSILFKDEYMREAKEITYSGYTELSLLSKINTRSRYLIASLLKPFYYYEIYPLSLLYERTLKLAPRIVYSDQTGYYLK